MFNRAKKLSGIGNAVFDSLSFGGVTPEGCPDAGILLRTVDTSRYESDANNVSFFMPYSTSFFTDGTCGETPVETWGLQYLPAGWVTNIRNENVLESWDFTTSDNTSATGSVYTKYETFWDTEDGTGINYAASQGFTYFQNSTIVQTYFDGYTYRWNVWWSDSGNYFWLEDYTMYPTYGTYVSQTDDPVSIYISESDSYAVAGTATNNNYADGYGGSYQTTVYINWIQNNEIIQTISTSYDQSYDSDNGQYYQNGFYSQSVAKSNGSGGYYTDSIIGGSYWSSGEFVRVYSDVPYTASWYGYTFNNGQSERINRIWDGNGGFTNSYPETAGEFYPQYTVIGSGYYDSSSSGPYDLYWNGDGTIGSTYQGGSNCDSYGTDYGVQCLQTDGYDVTGNFFTGYWAAYNAIADGSCGTLYDWRSTNADGCYYPYGFYTSYNSNPSYGNWYIYDSSSNYVNSNSFTYADYGDYSYSDGSGGNITGSWNWAYNYGDQIDSGDYWDSNMGTQVYYTVYYDGNGGYFVTYSY